MQENTSLSDVQTSHSSALVKLFNKNFDLATIADEQNLSEVPLSDDVTFEYINLDLDRLNQSKKNNFWTYLLEVLQPHIRLGEVLTIDKLISHYPSFEEPLFPLKSKLNFVVEKIYNWILRLIGDSEVIVKRPEEKIKKMITMILDSDESIKDEFYLTLIKCSRNNPKKDSTEKVWHLLALTCGIVIPSQKFLPAIYNYLILVIDNFPDERFKEWARYCLKRLFYLDRNKFRRNFAPTNQEIATTKSRKKVSLPIYLQNGNCFQIYVESYNTAQDILKHTLNILGIPRKFWPHFQLVDVIVKTKALDERILSENLMIGDVLSGWEILSKSAQEGIKSCRIFLSLKFFPEDSETSDYLLQFIYFSKLYDVYFNKCGIEKSELTKLIGFAMQNDFGNYEDKPGVKNKVKNYFHPYFGKYYNDDAFFSSALNSYKSCVNFPKDDCQKRISGIDSTDFEYPSSLFMVRFRNSNNPVFKDLQESLALKITKDALIICEEVSKEKITEIKIEEIMNWGISEDIFLVCYGDKYDVVKIYFQVYNPLDLGEILFHYANQLKSGEVFDYISKNEHLEKFVINHKNRRSNVFWFK